MVNESPTHVTEQRDAKDYVRFIVLCADRTGSYMLTTSLNSSPNIVCIGELFNPFVKHINFRVDGHKIVNPDKRALRNTDSMQVLDSRVFCERPNEIRAVGFKAPHPHFWAQNQLLEWLVSERDVRVLHLCRRNMLRRLVSQKIALQTGVWTEYQGDTFNSLAKLKNVVKAARHRCVRRQPCAGCSSQRNSYRKPAANFLC